MANDFFGVITGCLVIYTAVFIICIAILAVGFWLTAAAIIGVLLAFNTLAKLSENK